MHPTPITRLTCLLFFLPAFLLQGEPLLNYREITMASQDKSLELMKQVVEWQTKDFAGHPPGNWKVGTFYSGVTAAYHATGEENFLEAALDWCEEAEWKLQGTPFHADNICMGQTFLDIYFIEKDPKMIAHTREILELKEGRDTIRREELTRHTTWQEDERPLTGRNLWWWCDALYMEPPVLARMSAATGDPKYREWLHEWYWDTVDFLYDPKERLFFRDAYYFPQDRAITSDENVGWNYLPRARQSPSGKKVFWGRGNGWVFGGLARLIPYLPDDDPMKSKYVDLFREMAWQLVQYQGEDGLWRTAVNDPEWFPKPETSGSSFFTYGLAWGINAGILQEKEYLPHVLAGWEGLAGKVSPEGKLGWAQYVDSQPRDIQAEHAIDYTHGAFLLAASEIYKMNITLERVHKLYTGPEVRTIVEDGVWTWFNDERAVFMGNHLYVGHVTSTGKSAVTSYLVKGGGAPRREKYLLSSWEEVDDHNNPGLVVMDDGRLLACYARHHTETAFNWRIGSTQGKTGYLEWSAENENRHDSKVTYSHVYQLSAENGRIYNFFRGLGFDPNLVISDDRAGSWGTAFKFIENGEGDGVRPYVVMTSNGRDRIDILYTDGHPRKFSENNLYHLYYQGGQVRRSDGTVIRSLDEVAAGKPIQVAEGALVYNGSGKGGRGWCWDIEYKPDGGLAAVWMTSADGDDGLDLRYRYGSFDPETKQWTEQEIAYNGRHLYPRESHYAGGICIDPADPNRIYLSAIVDPKTGQPNGTERFQLYLGESKDGGKTWDYTRLTHDLTVDNLRPTVVRDSDFEESVLWLRGRYDTFRDYQTDVVGFLEN